MAEEANDSKSAAAGSADNMDGQIMGEVSGITKILRKIQSTVHL